MQRRARIAAWSLGLLIGLPVLLIASLLVGANTAPGRHMIEALTPRLTGGTVVLQDLHGRFPDRLRAGHVELRDPAGTYTTIDGLALDWHPIDLLHRQARIDRLAADRITVARSPQSSSSQSSSQLPARIDIGELRVDRLEIDEALAGTKTTLSLTGNLHLASLDDIQFDLAAKRSDASGTYTLSGTLDTTSIRAHIAADEPAQGLLSELAGLPDLGALTIAADLDGPRNQERVTLSAQAGKLTAKATGLIDLTGQTLDLDISAAAPEMEPAPTVTWQSVALDAHAHGSFTAPDASGRLEIVNLRAGDGSAEHVRLDLSGNSGKLDLAGSITALRLPGPQPELLATAPVEMTAEMIVDDPTRPVRFTISHPLLGAEGHAVTAGDLSAEITARIGDLRPFASAGNVDLAGRATIDASLAQHGTTSSVTANGTIALTGGRPEAVQMIGDDGHFSLAANLDGSDVTLDRFAIDGKRARAEMSGSAKQGITDLDWRLSILDIAPLAPSVTGTIDLHGTLKGSMTDLGVTAEADASLATAGFPRSPIHLSLTASGLPDQPKGHITADGMLDRAKLQIDLTADRGQDGTLHLVVDHGDWRSVHASGNMTVPANALPIGKLQLRIGTLADLAPFIGAGATGNVDATVDWVEGARVPQARIRAVANQMSVAGNGAQRVAIEGTIDDPLNRQVANLRLTADNIAASGLTGSAQLDANGPISGLALKLSTQLQQAGQAISTAATGQLSVTRRELTLATLSTSRGPQTVRLLSPSRISFANGVSVDRLRLGIDRATIEIAGRVAPSLDITASVRDLSLGLAQAFVPGLAMQGTISGDAKLSGPIATPDGTIRVTANGIKLGSGPANALPPSAIQANIQLKSGNARMDGKLTAGNRAQLSLSGQVPMDSTAPLNLKATGTLDLALLNPLLGANGRSALGHLTLDAAIAGTVAAPRATGTAQLANGDFQDYTQGLHITAISASLQADGDTLRLQRFTGRAGSGTIAATGTIGWAAPGMPVAIDIEAQNARPLQSDLITATLDGKLSLRGRASERLTLGGRLTVSRAEITIPDNFPPNVAKLNVRIPGHTPPPAPSGPSLSLPLDLTIDAPRQVFVRGHGLDSEMGGSLRITGDASAPQIIGGFDLRHGTLSLAGQAITFTSGKVSFEGGSVSGKLDPAINFVAQTNSGGVTATLTISGYADQPKIALSSSPELPQDEVLAHLLFGQSVKQLGPLQLAEIAEALASLSGAGFGNPLTAVRQGLGLDRLNLSSDGTSTGGTVEAGKYVANGVYVGAKQGSSGGTQAQVQIDITKHLKLESTVGTGSAPATGATPQSDPGSSLGLTYQFEY